MILIYDNTTVNSKDDHPAYVLLAGRSRLSHQLSRLHSRITYIIDVLLWVPLTRPALLHLWLVGFVGCVLYAWL